jgi:Holliday junction resolvasome RuvABC ATP-dependent DNA helicase subunit
MENQEIQETIVSEETEPLEILTDYFRRTSRGRIIELPRWA